MENYTWGKLLRSFECCVTAGNHGSLRRNNEMSSGSYVPAWGGVKAPQLCRLHFKLSQRRLHLSRSFVPIRKNVSRGHLKRAKGVRCVFRARSSRRWVASSDRSHDRPEPQTVIDPRGRIGDVTLRWCTPPRAAPAPSRNHWDHSSCWCTLTSKKHSTIGSFLSTISSYFQIAVKALRLYDIA